MLSHADLFSLKIKVANMKTRYMENGEAPKPGDSKEDLYVICDAVEMLCMYVDQLRAQLERGS